MAVAYNHTPDGDINTAKMHPLYRACFWDREGLELTHSPHQNLQRFVSRRSRLKLPAFAHTAEMKMGIEDSSVESVDSRQHKYGSGFVPAAEQTSTSVHSTTAVPPPVTATQLRQPSKDGPSRA